MKKTYKKLTELNPKNHPSTGQIICYTGRGPWNPNDEFNFVEMSACEHKIRLHKIELDTDKDWIAKLKRLRDALNHYIDFLEKRASKSKSK